MLAICCHAFSIFLRRCCHAAVALLRFSLSPMPLSRYERCVAVYVASLHYARAMYALFASEKRGMYALREAAAIR